MMTHGLPKSFDHRDIFFARSVWWEVQLQWLDLWNIIPNVIFLCTTVGNFFFTSSIYIYIYPNIFHMRLLTLAKVFQVTCEIWSWRYWDDLEYVSRCRSRKIDSYIVAEVLYLPLLLPRITETDLKCICRILEFLLNT